MEKSIVLFGGAFDPPHNGHLRMAQAATEQLNPGSLLWIPTGNPPHRQAAQASFKQRCDMIEGIIHDQPSWQLCTLENSTKKSYFIDTLNSLMTQQGPAKFHILIGQDQLESFTQWHQWEQIVEQATLLVMPRQGYNTTSLPNSAPVEMLAATEINACSTDIKKNSDSLAQSQLPTSVREYIAINRCYSR
jgi:nicotinate-nucleotide adenylyltransferase